MLPDALLELVVKFVVLDARCRANQLFLFCCFRTTEAEEEEKEEKEED